MHLCWNETLTIFLPTMCFLKNILALWLRNNPIIRGNDWRLQKEDGCLYHFRVNYELFSTNELCLSAQKTTVFPNHIKLSCLYMKSCFHQFHMVQWNYFLPVSEEVTHPILKILKITKAVWIFSVESNWKHLEIYHILSSFFPICYSDKAKSRNINFITCFTSV